MGERRRIPKKSISRHMWRHILTVGAWIIIFIIMGTINMVMMMTTMVSNVKTFVKIEAICNSGGQTTNVSGRAKRSRLMRLRCELHMCPCGFHLNGAQFATRSVSAKHFRFDKAKDQTHMMAAVKLSSTVFVAKSGDKAIRISVHP